MKLILNNVGCFDKKEIKFRDKLNLIVGNNYSGKSLVLDALFYSLTGVFPNIINENVSSGFRLSQKDPKKESNVLFYVGEEEFEYQYSKIFDVWKQMKEKTPDNGIIIYAMQDGSFVLWDSLINASKKCKNRETNSPLVLTDKNILAGVDKKFIGVFNKVTDWKKNFNQEYVEEFESLLNLIFIDSKIKVEQSRRINVLECTEYPVISVNGNSYFIHKLSHGIKRIIELIFLIYLSKKERLQYEKLLGVDEGVVPNYTIIIDDIENGLSNKTVAEITNGIKNLLEFNNFNLIISSRNNINLENKIILE